MRNWSEMHCDSIPGLRKAVLKDAENVIHVDKLIKPEN